MARPPGRARGESLMLASGVLVDRARDRSERAQQLCRGKTTDLCKTCGRFGRTDVMSDGRRPRLDRDAGLARAARRLGSVAGLHLIGQLGPRILCYFVCVGLPSDRRCIGGGIERGELVVVFGARRSVRRLLGGGRLSRTRRFTRRRRRFTRSGRRFCRCTTCWRLERRRGFGLSCLDQAGDGGISRRRLQPQQDMWLQ